MHKLLSTLLLLAASAPAFAAAAAIPEPGTLALLAVAGIGAYLVRRKK